MTVSAFAIGAAIVASGLVAGFLWGWGVSAIPGLRGVSDRTYVSTMQSVNRAILNPVFLVVFVGSFIVLVAAAVVTIVAGDTRRGWWLLSASVVYALGVFGITAAGNVPLNNKLEEFDVATGTDETFAGARRDYEGPWNRLHHVRSAMGVVVVALASVAALTSTED